MKITLEGKTFHDIAEEMESLLAFIAKKISQDVSEKANKSAVPSAELAGPGPSGPEPVPEVIAPVDKPVDKPVESASDKMAKVRAARGKKPKAVAAPEPPFVEPATLEQAVMDPAEIVKIRAQTIEELQSAYANGLQKEVFELLSRFGNGAKSFRELPPEAFMPIRQAIDNGALT